MENGATVDGMAMGGLPLPMAIPMTVSIVLIKDMAVVVINGVTDVSMMECFAKIVVMVEGPLPGLMAQCTKENSDQANVKDRGRTSLVTEDGTKAVGRMDDTMAMVFVSGRTDGVTRENGSTEWRTEKESKPLRMGLSGTTVNGSKMNPFRRKLSFKYKFLHVKQLSVATQE